MKTLRELLKKRDHIEDRIEEIDWTIQCGHEDGDEDEELYDLEHKLDKVNKKILKRCKEEIERLEGNKK